MCWVLSFLIICLPHEVDFKLVFNFCSVSSRNWLNRIKTAFVRSVPIVVEFCCLLTIVCFVIEWLINDSRSNLAATSLKWKPCKHLIEVPLSKTMISSSPKTPQLTMHKLAPYHCLYSVAEMLLNFLLVLMIYSESFNSKTLKMFHIFLGSLLLVLTSHVRRYIYLSSTILYSWNNAPMFKLCMGHWIQEIPLPEFRM
jgi:hypothetical protein